jgi:transcriptional antiterminator
VADPEDYRIEGRRMTFLSFLSEMSREAQIDTAISQMQDEEDDKLDPAVKRKIDQAEARGDGKKASMLRQQAKRRNRLSTPQEPKTPTQQRVEQKKKELADAIRRDKNTPGDE